jgi:beta-aspartyl-peptidase (threonine type)
MSWAVVVHGGAGEWDPARHDAALAGTRAAAALAARDLQEGRSALDAAVAAVVALEDDPLFNAGTGSVLNRDGDVEMDASVATGHDLGFGAVAALRRVRNPILVARKVLECSGHVLLAGEGALRFAREQGFEDYDPATTQARAEWQRAQNARLGTVGAVALDGGGRLAAATSTGGMLLKLPGRVGDSPLPGAGTYATAHAAVSATGRGELIMRALAAKSICDFVENGHSVRDALKRILAVMRAGVGADAGFIAISHDGSVASAHETAFMVHAWATSSQPEAMAAMRADASV